MNYYRRNKDKILKKAHEKYHNGGGKEKTKKYYRENKEKIKKKRKRKIQKIRQVSIKGQSKKKFRQILQTEKRKRRK